MSKNISFDTPALYGDHHVLEVRRVLQEIAGVEDVYASSAFRAVEVSFDPDKVDEETIKGKLESLGYLDELPVPVETSAAPYQDSEGPQAFFRHTEAFETNIQEVSFAQDVAFSGRPLWHCPGFGVIKNEMED